MDLSVEIHKQTIFQNLVVDWVFSLSQHVPYHSTMALIMACQGLQYLWNGTAIFYFKIEKLTKGLEMRVLYKLHTRGSPIPLPPFVFIP